MQTDLANFTDAAEFNMRFFAMLTGPFYPILHILKERSDFNVVSCLNTTFESLNFFYLWIWQENILWSDLHGQTWTSCFLFPLFYWFFVLKLQGSCEGTARLSWFRCFKKQPDIYSNHLFKFRGRFLKCMVIIMKSPTRLKLFGNPLALSFYHETPCH